MRRNNEVQLGDCIEFLNGFAFKSKSFTDDPNDIVLVKGENLGKGRILWNESKYWNRYDEVKFAKYILREHDIVLAMDRPWVGGGLKYAFIKKGDPKSFLVQRVCCLRAKANAYQPFIRYVIGSEPFALYLKSIMGGVAVPHISPDQIKSYKFDLPPLHTQNKIASILSAYDDLIENNLKRIKLLEELAQRTYEEWFVKFRVNGKQLKVNKETGLPVGWIKNHLGEVAEFVSRGISPKYVVENGIPIVNQKCIRNGIMSLPQSRLTSLDTKIAKEKYLQLLDVLINSTGAGTLGRVAQVTYLDKDITVDTHVSIVRANKKIVSPILLGFSIKSQEALITSLGKGSTNQLELSRNDLRDLIEVIVPDTNSQKQFDRIIEPTLKLASNLSNQNSYLKEARDILLPRLMSGVIEVGELEEELALAAEPLLPYR